MILTEDQAKTKWCPEVRLIEDHGKNILNNRGELGDVLCLASGCMAWRWATGEHKAKGYCGRAGEVKE